MPDLSQFPSAEMEFDRDAKPVSGVDEVLDLANGDCTDLIVMSHGWNNDAREARDLYKQFAASMREVLNRDAVSALRARKIAIVGVLWPSKKFSDDDGGGLGGAAGADSPDETLEVLAAIEALREVFPGPDAKRTLDSAKALVPQLEDSADARREFAQLFKTLVKATAVDDEDASEDLLAMDGGEIMDRLAEPVLIPASAGVDGGAAAGIGDEGGAAGFFDMFTGPLGAAKKLANLTTFYEMKARAGEIGARGVAPVIAQVNQARPNLKVHLVGHSFGARLVSATAKQLPGDTIATMSLLQGAFSHHGFARDFEPGRSGFFRQVVDNETVGGPMVITKTANDKPVGLAYAIASFLANEAAAGLGDASDRFGGIGRNGAVKTAEAVEGRLLPVGGSYAFRARALHNLLADEFIKNHSDVKGVEVAYAVLSAIAT
jgi:hypothetical protein